MSKLIIISFKGLLFLSLLFPAILFSGNQANYFFNAGEKKVSSQSLVINSQTIETKNDTSRAELQFELYRVDTNLKGKDPNRFGGFSGIDYDSTGKFWFLVTDGNSSLSNEIPYRQSLLFRCPCATHSLPDWENCKPILLPKITEAESVRFVDGTLFFSTEHDTNSNPKYDGNDSTETFYKYKIDSAAFSKDSIIINPNDIKVLIKEKYKIDKGFESLYIKSDTLWSITEQPLEGEQFSKLTAWKIGTNATKIENPYIYNITIDACSDKIKDNGITDILYDNKLNTFLVLERCWNGSKNTVILYETKITNNQLIKKRAINISDKLGNINSDNLEGMTWGPKIDNRRTLFFISDDNFKERSPQKTNLIILIEK